MMLPKTVQPNLACDDYLSALRTAGFKGEIDTSQSIRLINATDNSPYQVLPDALLFPKSSHDIQLILTTAKNFPSIAFTARGGGTGTNGQALNDSIIIDCSKYLNHILELNLDEAWVRVEPGVVLDQLNHCLKPHGYFFAPHVSPSNRATIGGMTNTDACGKGSRVYGKTSQHVLSITAVYSNAELHTTHAIDLATLEQLKKESNLLSSIYQEVDEIVCQCQHTIENTYPKLQRFMTGYDLAHVYDTSRTQFNLNAILCGSEGSLVIMTEIKLKITPLPKYKSLVVLQYKNFIDALLDAKWLIDFNPHAIETMDELILSLARTDLLYPSVSPFIESSSHQVAAINLIEFCDNDLTKLENKISQLKKSVEQNHGTFSQDYKIVNDSSVMESLWKLREKSVGLLGKIPGSRKPISGIEDTVVPPEYLADYVRKFRKLLDDAGLRYAMYGHIDVGCLHVRPALDLRDSKDESLYYSLIDEVANLAKQYGGLLWGEHGKGFRSQYIPLFFGTELYPKLQKIKKCFDPLNRFNPGKIVTPFESGQEIKWINSTKRADFDKHISPDLAHTYSSAMSCNGNGACFNYNKLDVMCPSYKVTQDRIHSPKGRASLIRHWIYLKSGECGDPADNLSHEVYNAMQGCLGCKACKTQCPVNVDIPTIKSQFLESYHAEHRRPWRDYAIAYSEMILPYFASYPNLSNFLFYNPLSRWLTKKIFQLESLPIYPTLSLKKLCHQKNISFVNISDLQKLTNHENVIVIVQDFLSSSFEPMLVLDYYFLLKKLGFSPYILKLQQNGKSFHTRGFLKKFKKIATDTAHQFEKIAKLNIPMIGIDPSLTLTYRQEYSQTLGELNFQVQLFPEWFTKVRFQGSDPENLTLVKQELFMHCSEKTAEGELGMQWKKTFKQLGIDLQIVDLGCCGMAGNYGMESEHQEYSHQLFDMGWSSILTQAGTKLVTGFSCRHQAIRFKYKNIWHPVSYLQQLID